MSNAYTAFVARTKATPQTERADARQVKNNAGGFVYAVDPWQAFERFLILGTEGGTYYAAEQKHTKQAAQNTALCIAQDGKRAVDLIVAISDAGRAVKNDPAIFALALAVSGENADTRAYALGVLPKVCRIPTHLFHFVAFVDGLRGWGRGLRRAVASWYLDKPVSDLAYHMVKYQARDGWSNRDLLRLAHPKTTEGERNALFNWIVKGYKPTEIGVPPYPELVLAFELAKLAEPKELIGLIEKYNLPREALPTSALTKAEVWEALLPKMPLTALIRNLGNLSKVGLLAPLSAASKVVQEKLANGDLLRKSRVHPLTVLNALKTYASGHGLRGTGSWPVVPQVVDALDHAFYASFGNVTPTHKNLLFGLDVSGSMTSGAIGGTSITPIEAVGALAMVTAKVEPNYLITAFSTQYRIVDISTRTRLDDVVHELTRLGMGGTDCSLPMLAAAKHKWKVDAFIIMTDNETWHGAVQPMQALRTYRKSADIPNAKLIVAGMTATKFTIADPLDPLTLDVVGFDLNAPQALSEFVRS